MSKSIDDLLREVKELEANAARLEKIDAGDLFSGSRTKRSDSGGRSSKPKKNEKPDWVASWNRQNARNGPVKTVVKTTDTYHEERGVVETKTELVEPPVVVEHARNLETGEVEERVKTSGLPEHLRLDKLHDDAKAPTTWAEKPTHDGVAPRDLSKREALAYLAANPGNPLETRDEGPTKPVRKQMLRLNKVWKYRNFQKCGVCECYDTWESRTDPYVDGTRLTHAEVWCHTCGAVDLEVADSLPAHIGTWAAPKETPKQIKDRAARQHYRRTRTIFSLIQSPKTAAELALWFREVEKYEAVDVIMLDLMLHRMKSEGLVACDAAGKWWDREDYEFEHPAAERKESERKDTHHDDEG